MATALQIHSHRALFCSALLNNGNFNKICTNSVHVLSSSKFRVSAVKGKTEEIKSPSSAEDVTKKYGLEAGLWKVPFLLFYCFSLAKQSFSFLFTLIFGIENLVLHPKTNWQYKK